MLITLAQLAKLYLFLFTGFFLCKAKILKADDAAVLSKLYVYVFFPCITFRTFANQFTVSQLSAGRDVLLPGIGIFAVLLLLSILAGRLLTRDRYERNVITYSCCIPNSATFIYPLVHALYDELMLMHIMLYVLPITVYSVTEGYRLLLDQGRLRFRSLLNNPILIALVLGAIVGLTGIRLPVFLSEAIQTGGDCMAPLGLILIGITIAGFRPKDVFGNWRVYAVTAIRLILFPAAIVLIGRLLRLPEELLLIAMLVNAAPAGMNTIVFPQLIHKDCRFGAGLVMVSSTLLVVTLPLLLRVFFP